MNRPTPDGAGRRPAGQGGYQGKPKGPRKPSAAGRPKKTGYSGSRGSGAGGDFDSRSGGAGDSRGYNASGRGSGYSADSRRGESSGRRNEGSGDFQRATGGSGPRGSSRAGGRADSSGNRNDRPWDGRSSDRGRDSRGGADRDSRGSGGRDSSANGSRDSRGYSAKTDRPGGGFRGRDAGPSRGSDGARSGYGRRDQNAGSSTGGFRGTRLSGRDEGERQYRPSGEGRARPDGGRSSARGDGRRDTDRRDQRGGSSTRDDRSGRGYRGETSASGGRDQRGSYGSRDGGGRPERDARGFGGSRGDRDSGYRGGRDSDYRGGARSSQSDDRRRDKPERSNSRGPRASDRPRTAPDARRGGRDFEPARVPRIPDPEVPQGLDLRQLPRGVRAELRGLPSDKAEVVGAHLLMAGRLVDTDPELANEHAQAAKRRAPRLPIVREAVGETAYAAGDYVNALTEFRAVRRMTGTDEYLPAMADCERALGRSQAALRLIREGLAGDPDTAARVELRLVEAGVRADSRQFEEASRLLKAEIEELGTRGSKVARGRLRYGYADLLERSGQLEQAERWFEAASVLDPDQATDAADRVAALRGITIEFDDAEDDEWEEASELEDEAEAENEAEGERDTEVVIAVEVPDES